MIKSYNYKRALKVKIAFMMIALWSVVVSTFSFIYDYDNFFELILVSGVGLIFMIGVGFSSRSPNYFIADYEDSIPSLMRFQFMANLNENVARIKYFSSLNISYVQDSTALNRTAANKLF